ncbi:unnamed protein product [Amoebophrya sp. A25]|nr:unnamed protein product [Amoebophrya sp. A25]|eukprot:GSA25T00005771001.1
MSTAMILPTPSSSSCDKARAGSTQPAGNVVPDAATFYFSDIQRMVRRRGALSRHVLDSRRAKSNLKQFGNRVWCPGTRNIRTKSDDAPSYTQHKNPGTTTTWSGNIRDEAESRETSTARYRIGMPSGLKMLRSGRSSASRAPWPTILAAVFAAVAALFLSACLGVEGKITRVRLPTENELANTCYFTYRMNFIICDQTLSQEEAAQAIKRGECHSDYKIMGANFQIESDKYVLGEAPPPIEAAFWLIGMPENFQTRTMEECPAIMILSYVVIAEAALFLHGPKNELATGFVRDAAVISRTMKYQETVMRSWSINPAFHAYQRLHNAVLEQTESLAEKKEDLSINVVVCRCGTESLRVLEKRLELIDRKATKIFVQELCLEETALQLAAGEAASAGKSGADALAGKDIQTYMDIALRLSTEFYPQSFKNITLTTLAAQSCSPVLPEDLPIAEYTLFMGRAEHELENNANTRFLDLVFRSMEINTFLLTDFVHLGNFRSVADDLSACQEGIARQLAEMRGVVNKRTGRRPVLSTYRGDLFAVKREAMAHITGLKLGSELCAPEGLGPVWPLLFGKPFLLPTHEDDASIPTFLRTLDENSTATLPKKFSNYLTYVFENNTKLAVIKSK